MSKKNIYDVIVIGAGPSGAVAAALLAMKGRRVVVLERETFPRFSIGESLLPQCMEYLEEASMLEAVVAAGFQKKNGAVFQHSGKYSNFDFSEQFTEGWSETFQVERSSFDKILADEAERLGAEIRYGCEIKAVELGDPLSTVTFQQPDGSTSTLTAHYLMDASGFGRVLPRLLGLEEPSDFPLRSSLFTHIEDNIQAHNFDRDKILISVHPTHRDVWFWLIPFSNGRSSIGVVAEPEFLDQYDGDAAAKLRALVEEDPELANILVEAAWDSEANQIRGYSAKARPLASNQYALLGNAAEFIDPVFSSGVTIALRSASMAARLLNKQLPGEFVDWEREYADPLGKGVTTFRAFVNAWYDGRFQDVIFYPKQSKEIRRMICSILAGYAWDEQNPYVKSPERRLNSLAQYCKSETRSV